MVFRVFHNTLLTRYFPFILTMTVMFVLHARSSPYTTKPVPVPALVPVPVTKYSKEDHNHHDHKPIPVPALVPVPDTKYSKEDHKIINNFFEARKEWTTTNLGTYLFKNGIKLDKRAWNKSLHGVFNVLIWKHWKWLKRRHIDGFIEHDNNPLYGCSVSNCRFSGSTYFETADAVVIHIQKGLIPKVASRNPHQIWIFWVDESPKNAFSLSKKKPSFKELSNIFNWSMTYRRLDFITLAFLYEIKGLHAVAHQFNHSTTRQLVYLGTVGLFFASERRTDSDVPIPYGRTVPLLHPKTRHLRLDKLDHNLTITILEELVPFWKDKRMKPGDVLATILISHCFTARMRFLMELKKHMNIDIYGGCAEDEYQKKRCPGHFRSDCKILSRYLFYIVMENSKCRQYISEKSFHHAYSKGAIPVFVGPFLEDCERLLPPNSFLHIDNFKTPEHLAVEIDSISKNATKLLSYHSWRNHFKVVNEHGYFGTMSAQMCRICEALNYNQRSQKVYGVSNIRRYLDPKIQCH